MPYLPGSTTFSSWSVNLGGCHLEDALTVLTTTCLQLPFHRLAACHTACPLYSAHPAIQHLYLCHFPSAAPYIPSVPYLLRARTPPLFSMRVNTYTRGLPANTRLVGSGSRFATLRRHTTFLICITHRACALFTRCGLQLPSFFTVSHCPPAACISPAPPHTCQPAYYRLLLLYLPITLRTPLCHSPRLHYQYGYHSLGPYLTTRLAVSLRSPLPTTAPATPSLHLPVLPVPFYRFPLYCSYFLRTGGLAARGVGWLDGRRRWLRLHLPPFCRVPRRAACGTPAPAGRLAPAAAVISAYCSACLPFPLATSLLSLLPLGTRAAPPEVPSLRCGPFASLFAHRLESIVDLGAKTLRQRLRAARQQAAAAAASGAMAAARHAWLTFSLPDAFAPPIFYEKPAYML